MTIKIGVVMDPIAQLNYKKDSTLAMLWAAQDRGWQLYYMEQSDLYLDQGVARVVIADLLVLGEIVNDLPDRQEVGEWPAASLLARVGRDGDGIGLVVFLARRGFDLRFVEEPALFGNESLALGAEALGLRQALPFL